MDEPTGNLDNRNIDNFMSLILDLSCGLDISLIIATHDIIMSQVDWIGY